MHNTISRTISRRSRRYCVTLILVIAFFASSQSVTSPLLVSLSLRLPPSARSLLPGPFQRRGANRLRDEVSAAQEHLKLSEAKRHEVLLSVCALLVCALNFLFVLVLGVACLVRSPGDSYSLQPTG